jgi:hypothetical protein
VDKRLTTEELLCDGVVRDYVLEIYESRLNDVSESEVCLKEENKRKDEEIKRMKEEKDEEIKRIKEEKEKEKKEKDEIIKEKDEEIKRIKEEKEKELKKRDEENKKKDEQIKKLKEEMEKKEVSLQQIKTGQLQFDNKEDYG